MQFPLNQYFDFVMLFRIN